MNDLRILKKFTLHPLWKKRAANYTIQTNLWFHCINLSFVHVIPTLLERNVTSTSLPLSIIDPHDTHVTTPTLATAFRHSCWLYHV